MVNENKANQNRNDKHNHEIREPMGEQVSQEHKPQVLSAGQWLRAVVGVEAPFGHDGMPTVWG